MTTAPHRPWGRGCHPVALLALLALLTPPPAARADDPPDPLPAGWAKALQWRPIGPAAMGGRVTAVSVYEADPSIYYVATASGGLLKTVNNGVTFEHQFDRQKTVSVGDVCVWQKDPDVVWVGTGEANPRNSVSYGDGVYKSTDGGKTWLHMGLEKSFQVGKILIHPDNADVVYVGVLGRLYGPNPERGLYKTTDGGRSWDKVLYVDEDTGVIDMRMHPTDPDTLLVATYQRRRDGLDGNDPAVKIGKGSGLYRTADGGKTWDKVTEGLPECELGRIGLDWYRKDPSVVFMVLESAEMGKAPKGVKVGNGFMGIQGGDGKDKKGAVLTQVVDKGPAEEAGLKVGDVIVRFGPQEVKGYEDLLKGIRAFNGGDEVDVEFLREGKANKVKLTLGKRDDAASARPFSAYLGGQRENVQDKQGPDGYRYGGVYRSGDGGKSWRRVNSLNPRPMYFSEIRVDPSDEKRLYVLGISLHRSDDGGKTFKGDGGRGAHPDHHALWIDPRDGRHMVLGNDGGFYATYDRMANWDHLNNFALGQFYHVAVDTRPDYKVYGGLQDNGTWGGPSFTREPGGPVNADWFRVSGGDGFRCAVDPSDPDLVYSASQFGSLRRRNFRTGESAAIKPPAQKGVKYRFNWNTPFILSAHDPKVYYSAGNYVFRSEKRGDDLKVISPEVTRTQEGTASALAESPRDPKVLYVGTDDGALKVTRDGGKTWEDVTRNVGLPGPRWVASVEASRYADGRAYVAFDGHRSDDDGPHVYVTEDFGRSWQSLNANLPWGSTRVLREDIHNEDLLYLGTEFGAWFSPDRGRTWHSLNTNLPTVAVHEFAQHPTAGEVVAATHGRSLWVLDVTPLRGLTADDLAGPKLYRPVPVVRWVPQPSRGGTNREYTGKNPPPGAVLYYSLPAEAKKVALKVLAADGKVAAELKASAAAGLHSAAWNLAVSARPPQGRPPEGRPPQGRGPQLRPAPPGEYRAVLTVDGRELSQTFRVLRDPSLPDDAAADAGGFWEEEEGEEMEEEEGVFD